VAITSESRARAYFERECVSFSEGFILFILDMRSPESSYLGISPANENAELGLTPVKKIRSDRARPREQAQALRWRAALAVGAGRGQN